MNVDIYMSARINDNIKLTSNYQDNISTIEQYMLDDTNKNKINKYVFKIFQNDGIFSIMDSNYNLLKHDSFLESSLADGYLQSSISISSLLENFIVSSQ